MALSEECLNRLEMQRLDLYGTPCIWQRSEKKILGDFSGTCLILKETKSRNLVSVGQSMWTRQTIFGDPGRKCPPSLDRVKEKVFDLV